MRRHRRRQQHPPQPGPSRALKGETLNRIPFRRLVLPGALALASLLLHQVLPADGTPRLLAGAAFWFLLAWAGVRAAALLLARHPKLLSDLVGTALYVAATLVVMQVVFELPATGLIATSSVVIAVLGFALRNIFGDIFSGIALGMESPYAIGDWIEATEGCAGRVTGISWRSTRLVTRDGVTLVVPNSLIAGHRIAVYGSGEGGRYRTSLPVALDAAVPADRARRILLAAAMEAGRDQRGFAPDVLLADLANGVATYAVRFHVPDFGAENPWRDQVAGAVQRALLRAGLAPAAPGREVRLQRAAAERASEPHRALVESLDLLRPFTAPERAALAAAMAPRDLRAGEVVVRQGDEGQSLYVLAEGVLEVRIERPDGVEAVVDRLYPGSVFGEMSLLTGQPRMATVAAATGAVVLELAKGELDPLLQARPVLAEGLTAIMAERQARNLAGPRISDQPSHAAPTRDDILARVKAFFGIR
ncbi:cyclic nucleotide-binding domain-containing protein [Roseomonas sp. HF4]|uniref:cyclic nucleotide-binding domain-containing protein n=1 Tax=Roseomonas sp. HF4 TaxID=2562313 RepID=UPI0010BF992E|nr:cyclic nucleotide-binding domain-containing protein [Roseomonas sp. HF4]